MAEEAKNIIEVTPTEVAATGIGALTPDQLQSAVDDEIKKRTILINYVRSQLVENTDYGKIKVGGRMSKDNLFKPGMEKVLSLMSLQSELTRDEETISMLKDTGWTKPTLAYKCVLKRGGVVLAEGRGACEVASKNNDVNTAIKIAEKRARMDATLSLGFSEFFTQDLEDMAAPSVDTETGEIVQEVPPQYQEADVVAHSQTTRPATEKQIKFARDLMKQKLKITTAGEAKKFLHNEGIEKDRIEDIDADEAKFLIDYLLKYRAVPQDIDDDDFASAYE
jgi:hypothetical protein